MPSRRVRLGRLNLGAALSLAGLASSVALACAKTNTLDAELDTYRQLRGELARAETSASVPRGRYLAQRFRLESGSGLEVTGWLVRPRADGCFAGVLLQDGREENSGVIARLPSEFGDAVVLSLDYPSELPYSVELSDSSSQPDADGWARKIPGHLSGRQFWGATGLTRAIPRGQSSCPFGDPPPRKDSRWRLWGGTPGLGPRCLP